MEEDNHGKAVFPLPQLLSSPSSQPAYRDGWTAWMDVCEPGDTEVFHNQDVVVVFLHTGVEKQAESAVMIEDLTAQQHLSEIQ